MGSEFLSIKEVAKLFNCHHTTIRRAIKLGHIVAIRLGTKKKSPYRISVKCIEEIHSAILFQFTKNNKKD